jgi:hypothetical protein
MRVDPTPHVVDRLVGEPQGERQSIASVIGKAKLANRPPDDLARLLAVLDVGGTD